MKLSILKAILYTLLLVVVWAVVELLVLLPYKYFVSKDLTSPELAIGLNVLATVAAYLSIFFLFNIPEDIEKTLFKFKRISYKVLLLILSLAIGMYLCDRFLWDLFNGVLVDALPFKNKFHPNDFLSFKFVLQTISIVCVSPFFEEFPQTSAEVASRY